MISIFPEKNTAPFSWWVAKLIWRFEIEGPDQGRTGRRGRVFRNTVVLKAPDRERARLMAVDRGLAGNDCAFDWINVRTGQRGRWTFAGVAGLTSVGRGPDGGASDLAGEVGSGQPIRLARPWLRYIRSATAE